MKGAVAVVLIAVLAASALAADEAASFPAYGNEGGPPFLQGPAVTLANGDGKSSVGLFEGPSIAFLFVQDDGGFGVANSTFLSWECGPDDGSYYALVDTDEGVQCEYGIFEAETGKLQWQYSLEACPTADELVREVMLLETDGLVNICAKDGKDA